VKQKLPIINNENPPNSFPEKTDRFPALENSTYLNIYKSLIINTLITGKLMDTIMPNPNL